MARYIDADKFLESQIERCGGVMPIIGTCTMDNEALSWVVEKTPTADVVEVVRCKDCKYYKANSCFNRQWDLESSVEIPLVREDDYCSYGERKCDNDGEV